MALTDDEKAEIRDHLDWTNGVYSADYVTVYVNPALDALDDPAKEKIVRAHLTRLNDIYTQLGKVPSKTKLEEVKGVKFSSQSEVRLWALHADWAKKLSNSLLLESRGADNGDCRMIVYDG